MSSPYPVMSTTVPWNLVKSGFKKTPHFNSLVQKTPTGRRSSIALMPFPTWDFEVDLYAVHGGEAIADSVLQSFLGCYMASYGGGSPFLFTDPNDNAVSQIEGCLLNVTPGAAQLGTSGDGTSTVFQLARTIGPAFDVLQNVSGYEVYLDGTPSGAAVGPTGLVTFSTPPAAGAMLSWDGGFQYLCQFTDDTLKDLSRFSKNSKGFLWQCSAVAFEGVFV